MGFHNPMVLASHYRLEECAGLNGIQLQFVGGGGGGGGGMKLNARILKGLLREESDLVMPPFFSESPTSVSQFLPVSCDSYCTSKSSSSSPTSVCQISHENCEPYYTSKSLPSTSASQFRHESCDPYCISRSPQSTCTSEVLPRNFNPCYISNCKPADEVCPEVHKEEEEEEEEEEGCNGENSAMYGETLFTELFGQTGANSIGLERYDKVKEESEPLVPMGSLQYQLAAPQEQYSVLGAINPRFSLFGAPIASQGFTENQQIGDPVISMAMAMPDSFSLQDTKSACWSGQIVDRSIEKKKNRMIKNRESAARSRARKQAHINKLEDEVRDLKIRREELMKRKEVEMNFRSSVEPKYKLRRTSSLPL